MGSRHHLLQMFAAINHLCSGCTVYAATKTDEDKVKHVLATQNANFLWISLELRADLHLLLTLLLMTDTVVRFKNQKHAGRST